MILTRWTHLQPSSKSNRGWLRLLLPATPIASRVSFVAVLLLLAAAPAAQAAITINAVDGARVSAYEHVPTTGVDAVVFGGIAGTCATNPSATDTTCTSCTNASTTGDAGLQPCNDHKINPNLQLVITITSSDHDGYPTIAYESSSTTSLTALTTTTTPSFVAKTNSATITVPWSSICGAIPINSGAGDSTCSLSSNTVATATGKFYVGMAATNGSLSTTDDRLEMTFTLSAGGTSASTTGGSVASTTNGIVYFEMVSGDSLGQIGNIQSGASSGFPNGQGINYRWVRTLFKKRAASSPDNPVWSSINRGSPHTDLEINATDSTNLNLSPVRITSGMAVDSAGNTSNETIDNDSVYDFKVAVVDEAGNASYYTAAADDQTCHNGTSSNNLKTGTPECHTIRPSVVAGLLANKINCFVATAAYGSPMAAQVEMLRQFRDRFLIPTAWGLRFVRSYYRYGPVAARWIAESETLRAISRAILWLPVQTARLSFLIGLGPALALVTALLVSLLAALVWAVGRRRKLRVLVRRALRLNVGSNPHA